MCHLASAQYWDQPAGGNIGHLFLMFCGPVCANWIRNCPWDRVLSYKNLIYLLNLQDFVIMPCIYFIIAFKVFECSGRS